MAIIVEPERMVEFASVAKDLAREFWKKTKGLDGNTILAMIDDAGNLKFVDITRTNDFIDSVMRLLKKEIACVISIFETNLIEDELVSEREDEKLVKLTRSKALVALVSGQCFIFAFQSKVVSKSLSEFEAIDPFSLDIVKGKSIALNL